MLTLGPPTQTKLRIDGAFALIAADLATVTVTGCPVPPPPAPTKPCTTATGPATSLSTKLRVNGQPVVLAGTLGLKTDGNPIGAPVVTGVQEKMTAS